MPQIDVYDLEGQVVEQMDLPESVFDGEVKMHLIHQMVKAQLAAKRAGTHSTLTRKEVHGTGAKPFRQKGGGRARAGDVKSPIWRHGGTTFGPKPRDYSQKMNKKMKSGALRSALNLKWKEGKLLIVRDLNLPEPKTRLMAEVIKNLNLERKALIVDDGDERNFELATRNIKGAKPMRPEGLNVYDIMGHGHLVCTKDALGGISERLAG